MKLGLLVASENDNTQTNKQTIFMFYKYRYTCFIIAGMDDIIRFEDKHYANITIFFILRHISRYSKGKEKNCSQTSFPTI